MFLLLDPHPMASRRKRHGAINNECVVRRDKKNRTTDPFDEKKDAFGSWIL
jgi:hypothetical protein